MMEYMLLFDDYCKANNLALKLSFDMPEGYETANGMFDFESCTVYINAAVLENCPDYEKLFYFFHELRHASQYLMPEQFDALILKSRLYVIMYNGICYKLENNSWMECRLDGTEEFFTEMYLGQPYEKDANTFAYDKVRSLLGDSIELQKLYAFWMPKKQITEEMYLDLYHRIDQSIYTTTP